MTFGRRRPTRFRARRACERARSAGACARVHARALFALYPSQPTPRSHPHPLAPGPLSSPPTTSQATASCRSKRGRGTPPRPPPAVGAATMTTSRPRRGHSTAAQWALRATGRVSRAKTARSAALSARAQGTSRAPANSQERVRAPRPCPHSPRSLATCPTPTFTPTRAALCSPPPPLLCVLLTIAQPPARSPQRSRPKETTTSLT